MNINSLIIGTISGTLMTLLCISAFTTQLHQMGHDGSTIKNNMLQNHKNDSKSFLPNHSLQVRTCIINCSS